jgi:hypothetical protein
MLLKGVTSLRKPKVARKVPSSVMGHPVAVRADPERQPERRQPLVDGDV